MTIIDWNSSSEDVSIVDILHEGYEYLKLQELIHTTDSNYMFVPNPNSKISREGQLEALMEDLENNIPHDIENGFLVSM